MAPIKVGLIGLSTGSKVTSFASRAHLPYLLSEQGKSHYEIVALCNTSVESAKKSVQEYKLNDSIKTYDSPKDLANDADVDLVVCIVGVGSHYDVLLPVVEAGKDIYTELPLASTMDQMKELATTAEKKGIKTMFGSQGTAHPAVHLVKKMIAEGKIGKVLSTTYVGDSNMSMTAVPASFRMFGERSGGGNLATVWFLHSFTCMLEIFGDLDAFSSMLCLDYPTLDIIDPSQGGKVIETIKKDTTDNIMLQGRFKSGATISYQMRAGEPFPGEPGCRWIIHGDKGDMLITNPVGSFDISHEGIQIKLRKTGEKEAQTIELPKDELSDMEHPAQNVGRLYEAFAKGDTGSYTNWKTALRRHELIDELFRRADGNKPFGEPAEYTSK